MNGADLCPACESPEVEVFHEVREVPVEEVAVDETVVVDGVVSEVYGLHAFTITGGLFTGDLPVIVPPDLATTPLAEGIDIQITGTVEAFVMTEIEADYGWDLSPEIEAEIEENEPVLIAQDMTPLEMEEGP